MALTDISLLFKDIIETPQQKQQRLFAEGQAAAGQFTGLPTGLRELAMGTAAGIPGTVESLRQFGASAGLPVQTQGEQLQRSMAGLNITDPTDQAEMVRLLANSGNPGDAATAAALFKEENEASLRAQQEFAMSQARDVQAIAESKERERTAIENRLLAYQQRNQGKTVFEIQEELERVNLEEAQIKLEKLKNGEDVDATPFGAPHMFPNGISTYISKEGTPIVKDLNGVILVDEEALVAIREGSALEVEQMRNINQARRQGTDASRIAAEAWEQIGTLQQTVVDTREAARLIIEEDAATTDIEALLNPLNQATRFLNQIVGSLTLQQLSQVTMGALSESELQILRETAAPGGFDKAEVAQWYLDKANAVEKAIGILDQQATYFSRPGATVGGWLEIQRQERLNAEQSSAAQDDADRAALLAQLSGEDPPSSVDNEEELSSAASRALEAAERDIRRGR